MNRKLLLGAIAVLALSLGPLLFAQHRLPPIFAETSRTLTGTVVEVIAMNPQSLIILEVGGPAAEPVRWQAILPSQTVLRTCFGWNKTSVKPGDNLLITGHAARSGASVISLMEADSEIVAGSGRTLFTGAKGTSLRSGACVAAVPRSVAPKPSAEAW